MEETLPKNDRKKIYAPLAALALGTAVLSMPAAAGEMVKFKITGDEHTPEIKESLTGKPGDPKNGIKVMINRKKGNCFACHTIAAFKDTVPYHGEVGPSLDGVADRYEEGQLRMMLVDQKKYFPNTIMPAMYRKDGLTRVMKKFKGKTILTAQEVEDVLAYLKTLK
ncbi:MAG TPA: sulfur oxidation c-type cytochrome SoxX [Gammaproteobacteria bacterium]|nr:sulfur oxidation c-type cytochrome SoxX [Gammaproteobacteria bacterium]